MGTSAKRISVTGLIVFGLMGCFSLFGQDFESGKSYFEQNQLNRAKNTFKQLTKKNPGDAKSWYYLGEVYFKQKNIDSAKFCYNSGISGNPDEALNYIGSGKILLQNQKTDEAKALFEKARKIHKKDVATICAIVEAAISGDVKDTTIANNYLNIAKDVDSKNSNIYIQQGNLQYLNSNYGDAANDYERAIYYDKKNITAFIKLGEIYASGRNYVESFKAYSNALKLDSTNVLIYKDLGDLNYLFGRYNDAVNYYGKYNNMAEITLEDKERYTSVLFFTKNYEAAQKEINDILKESPNNAVMYRLKAYISYETEDYKNGLDYMNQFFKVQDPKKVISTDYQYYGRLLIKNNQDSLAIINLKKAVVSDTSDVSLYEDLASALSRTNQHLDATNYFKVLIEKNPADAVVNYFKLGREYFLEGQKETKENKDTSIVRPIFVMADTAFSKVTQIAPDNYLGYFWRARTNSLIDPESELGLAKPFYESAAKLIEAANGNKNKKNLIECYSYNGYYYYLLSEKSSDRATKDKNVNLSIEYWNKVLALDPNDQRAKDGLNGLKK